MQGSNGRSLSYFPGDLVPGQESLISARLWPADWYSSTARGQPATPADREQLMAVLADVDKILIRAQFYQAGAVDVTVTDIQVETGESEDTGLGSTSTVEQCLCPAGYTGLSCETLHYLYCLLHNKQQIIIKAL